MGNEVRPYEFRLNALHSRLNELKDHPVIADVIEMAKDFWRQVAADSRISEEFREFLERGNPVEIAGQYV